MFGKNEKLGPDKNDGTSLYIHKIFPTIQGEGPRAGQPAIFIRLSGCNLACSFCDTDFEDFNLMTASEIVKKVDSYNDNGAVSLIIITGGEPMRQNLLPLLEQLIDKNYQCQIESNGTLFRPLPAGVEIICSPKVVLDKYIKPDPRLLSRITAFKFLISSNISQYHKVPELGQRQHNIEVFVQPMDEYDATINNTNNKLAVNLCLTEGYRLSCQIHKYLDIE
ncbi:MAG: 7-carboxy-7-deazaguanine synthase QueE [Candidatus Midichloriaceae bacterium]